MATRRFKPTSPARRYYDVISSEGLSKKRPERRLIESLRSSGGRNSRGRITLRHRGGGHRRAYRKIDFKRDKWNIPAKIVAIEYDPNRSARIALLHYVDGDKRYMLAPVGLKVGAKVMAGDQAEIDPGNCLPMEKIPMGTMIHNIEIHKGRGGQIVRSAGTAAQLLGKDGDYVQVKLPSTEVRKILGSCMATIGQVGNTDHENISTGKAGRNRWKGIRPTVRGVVMNPVDHPHGGGEGKSKSGSHPRSPWGWQTKGFKTRHNKRTDKFIVTRRKKKRRMK